MKTKYTYTNLVAGLIALAGAGSAWSSQLPVAENKLDPSYYDATNFQTIDFTDINLFYVRDAANRSSEHNARKGSKKGQEKGSRKGHDKGSRKRYNTPRKYDHAGLSPMGNFVASSSHNSIFTLNAQGYDGTSFDGYFLLTAKISENGTLEDGSFSFMSSDDLFGFGTETVCRKQHHRCKEKDVFGEVFGGTLTDLGWSKSEGLIEFATGDFTGWACDLGWCTEAERLWFNVDGGSIGFNKGRFMRGKHTDGSVGIHAGVTAVPVPAAIWLFGSGLIGLIGFARHRKT